MNIKYTYVPTVMGDEGSCEGTRDMEVGGASVVPFVRDGVDSIGVGGCRSACTTGVGGSGGSTIAFCGGRDNGEDVLCT